MAKQMEGTMRMIVIGADTHKDTHTAVAVADGTGQLVDELTAPARKAGFAQHLDWARGLDSERVWAIEDCRHVSGGLERFLVASGERVVRVPPKLMGKSRKGSRVRGKSDPIDAANVARAALQEGVENLPGAYLDERSMEIKLLLDHRENLVRTRTDDQRRLRRHLHQLFSELEIPAGALDRMVWLERIAGKLSRAPQGARVRVARELLRSIRSQVRRAGELEREIAALVKAKAPALLTLPGCGSLSAAKILAETAGPSALPPMPSWLALPALLPSPPPQGAAIVTASTVAAIASSIAPCIASQSHRAECIPPHAPISLESRRRGSQGWKPCVASSATWRVGFGSFCLNLKLICPCQPSTLRETR
jgi:transposase